MSTSTACDTDCHTHSGKYRWSKFILNCLLLLNVCRSAYFWALCRLSKHFGRNLHYLNVELFSREIIKDQLFASDLTFQTIFLHLDLLVVARTAPHHSYSNRAECIMSLLNIGLQNVVHCNVNLCLMNTRAASSI